MSEVTRTQDIVTQLEEACQNVDVLRSLVEESRAAIGYAASAGQAYDTAKADLENLADKAVTCLARITDALGPVVATVRAAQADEMLAAVAEIREVLLSIEARVTGQVVEATTTLGGGIASLEANLAVHLEPVVAEAESRTAEGLAGGLTHLGEQLESKIDAESAGSESRFASLADHLSRRDEVLVTKLDAATRFARWALFAALAATVAAVVCTVVLALK